MILERLQRIEAGSTGSTGSPGKQLQDHPDAGPSSRSTASDSPRQTLDSSNRANHTPPATRHASQQPHPPDSHGLPQIAVTLSTAVADCQRLRKRHVNSHRMFISGDAMIPLELTKAWLDSTWVSWLFPSCSPFTHYNYTRITHRGALADTDTRLFSQHEPQALLCHQG